MKKILFLGCHCDDIELGCGASINKLSGSCIDCVVLSQESIDGTNLKDISLKALTSLGANSVHFFQFKPSFFNKEIQKLWETLKQFDISEYDTVFTQEPDSHQDHVNLYEATNRLFRGKNIITYVSSIVSCPFFSPNYFVGLTESHVENKLKALENYTMYQNKTYFNPDVVTSHLCLNGALANCQYAEGFSIKRLII